MSAPETIPWNLVTKNLEGQNELLRKKLRQNITKLERHLTHFPPDAVHLEVVLERHPKKTLHTAALTLRVCFVEGFDPEEIAMVTRRPVTAVRESITSIQERLREEVLKQALI